MVPNKIRGELTEGCKDPQFIEGDNFFRFFGIHSIPHGLSFKWTKCTNDGNVNFCKVSPYLHGKPVEMLWTFKLCSQKKKPSEFSIQTR